MTTADHIASSDDSAAPLTAEQLAEAKEYGRRKLHCTLADMVLDLAFLLVFGLLFARRLDAWLAEFGWLQNDWLRLAVFFGAMVALNTLVSLPLVFYSGFVLEHRFDLSKQSLPRWFGRFLLQLALAIALGLLLVEGLYVVIRWTGAYWWLVAAAGSFVVSVVLGQLAPVLILPLFYKVERLADDDLMARFGRLAEGTGLKIEGIYRMQLSSETVKANAMLAGLGRTRRVILGDTLIDGFTPEEIEVVLAHEVGHHVFRHIRKFLLGGVVMSLLSFVLCDLALRQYVTATGGEFSYAALPIHALPIIMLTVSLLAQLLGPLQNAVSRHFERQCDRYALDRTGLTAAYRAAFSKLARLNKADPDPHPLEVFLFHDHPPIAERLAMAGEAGPEAAGPTPGS